ncbi:hypothetical protein Q9233_010742 [Columba guinea]|nr:hypothetical protein Q9233_010742 [Columba guinea]
METVEKSACQEAKHVWSHNPALPTAIPADGILFTMLVFGPACGFILGSFCTKIYVDAVFIDTSEENWVWFQIKYANVVSAGQKC